MIIACVLRSGGRFTTEWVEALQEGIERYHPGRKLLCLTDIPQPSREVIDTRFTTDLPGWWSKISLFEPGLFTGDRVLYLDLDTVVVGDLGDLLAWDGRVAVLSDFYHAANMASGVMLWRGDELSHIWDAFSRDPEGIMRRHPRRMDHFLRTFLNRADRIQDLFPGQVVSYKADLKGRHRPYRRVEIPEEARLVCMHGRPTLTDLPDTAPVRKAWGR